MVLPEQTIKELLSFNSGEPIIITPCSIDGDCKDYSVIAYVRTITNHTPAYINSVQLVMSFPISYPDESPNVKLNGTQLFHPNFTAEGQWVSNYLNPNETISEYIMRLTRTLQFKDIDKWNVGNRNAMAWYNRRKNDGTFPTDNIEYRAKPRISILRFGDTRES